MASVDRFRAEVVELLLGAADWRDVASDAVGALASAIVVTAREEFLGEPHDQAVATEHARTDYPDLAFIPPGGDQPSVVWGRTAT